MGESFYHVGLIVPELEPAMARLTALTGLTWQAPLDTPVPMRLASGEEQTVRMHIVYSVEQPCIELIEAVPGTPWARSTGSNLHHLGFWSDDLPADASRLGSLCPMEATLAGPSAEPVAFTYHNDEALGLRLELVDSASKPFLLAQQR